MHRWISVAVGALLLTSCATLPGTGGAEDVEVGVEEYTGEYVPDDPLTTTDRAQSDPAAADPSAEESPAPQPATNDPPTAEAAVDVGFRACDDAPPAPGSTHLEAGATLAFPVIEAGSPDVTGSVHLRHVATLHLPDGGLFIGSGWEGISAMNVDTTAPFTVAGGPVDAQVTASVWEPDGGPYAPTIAWLEVTFGAPGVPVSWEEVRALDIVTDGGDGALWSTAASSEGAGPTGDDPADLGKAFDAFAAVSWPEQGDPPLCVVRSTDGVEDGIVFPTGGGDGVYPTYVGRDAEGTVVALLSDGGQPWSTAGLPGRRPPETLADWPEG